MVSLPKVDLKFWRARASIDLAGPLYPKTQAQLWDWVLRFSLAGGVSHASLSPAAVRLGNESRFSEVIRSRWVDVLPLSDCSCWQESLTWMGLWPCSCFLIWMVQSVVLLPSGGSLCLEGGWIDSSDPLLLPRHVSVNTCSAEDGVGREVR